MDARIALALSIAGRGDILRTRELARIVGVSSSRLAHLFKSEVSSSLGGYLRAARLARAAYLLQSSDMGVKQISGATGYAHVPSFTRAFRRYSGLSPAAYRRAMAVNAKKIARIANAHLLTRRDPGLMIGYEKEFVRGGEREVNMGPSIPARLEWTRPQNSFHRR